MQSLHSAINVSTIPWLSNFQTTDGLAHDLQENEKFDSSNCIKQ